MNELDKDIAAYEVMQEELEKESTGKWVLFHDASLIDLYDSFEDAAAVAVREFGHGPYLIRQIGVSTVTIPASVMYRTMHG